MDNNQKILTDTAYGEIGERASDGYSGLLVAMRKNFTMLVDGKQPVFKTALCKNISVPGIGLYDKFLAMLPEDGRQHYNCNACRRFVNRYGGLVLIDDEDYTLIPAMWPKEGVDGFFHDAVQQMYVLVSAANVTDQFFATGRTLGTPITSTATGQYAHMSIPTLPTILVASSPWGEAAGDRISKARVNHDMLAKYVAKIQLDTINKAIFIMKAGKVYRPEAGLECLTWFAELKKTWKSLLKVGPQAKQNMLWYASANAPAGWCHLSTSLLGTMLDDIQDGLPADEVIRRYNEKAAPGTYMRPTAAPTTGQVAVAEKRVAELGVAESLERRWARFDELETFWLPPKKHEDEKPAGGVFSDIKTKDTKEKKASDFVIKQPTQITWTKFQRDILPMVQEMWWVPGYGKCALFSAVTAVHPDAPPIIKWDTEEQRNPVSMYAMKDGAYANQWNLEPGIPARVRAICTDPSGWYGRTVDPDRESVLFVLEGAKDVSGQSTSALFPTLLKPELHDIRAVIEAYSNQHALTGGEEADASGVSFGKHAHGTGGVFVVETTGGRMTYTFDRWD